MIPSDFEIVLRDSAISIAVILLMWGTGQLAFLFLRKLLAPYLDQTFFNKLKVPFLSLVILFGAYIAFHRLRAQDKAIHIVDNLIFTFAILFSIKLIYDLINMVIAWYTKKIELKTQITLDEKFVPLIEVSVKIIVALIGLIILMDHFNYNFSSVVAALGLGSLAIGLAAKDTLANTISGFIIMIDRPFKLYDRIQLVSGKAGIVISIGLRSVRMRDDDNNIIIIPNSELINMQIINRSQPDTKIRYQLKINVEDGTNLEKVKKILLEVAGQVEWIMKDPAPDALVNGFGDLGPVVNLRFWVDAERLDSALDAVHMAIYKRFKEENIPISFKSRLFLKSIDQWETIR